MPGNNPTPAPAFVALSAAQTALLVYLLARDHPADEVPRRAAVIGMGGPAYAGLRDWISIVTALANCTVSYVSGFITVEVTGQESCDFELGGYCSMARETLDDPCLGDDNDEVNQEKLELQRHT